MSEQHRPLDGGMDRIVQSRRPLWLRGAAVAVTILVAAIAYGYASSNGVAARSYAVDRNLLTISTVRSGEYLDVVPIRGSVTPIDTVYLDAIEGGRVESVLAEEGSLVEQGQPLLKLSNTALQLDVISREAQVSEQLNNLRNTRLALEQNRLRLRTELVELDYQIEKLGKAAERQHGLVERQLIPTSAYEDTLDELRYLRTRRRVTIESQEADEQMRVAQVASLESGIEHLELNLTIARKNLENLVVTAPISGQLTSLDAQIGESKARGERLGQIDNVEQFRINALLDEHYLTRLHAGQAGTFELSGTSHTVEVTKIYPEVRDGQIEVDLEFTGTLPANLRAGQSLQVRVALGDSAEALLLPRGGFVQDTGGAWAFVLDETGAQAYRREIRLGRRNPEYFEVIEGLRAGERVITSAYTGYMEMDRLKLAD